MQVFGLLALLELHLLCPPPPPHQVLKIFLSIWAGVILICCLQCWAVNCWHFYSYSTLPLSYNNQPEQSVCRRPLESCVMDVMDVKLVESSDSLWVAFCYRFIGTCTALALKCKNVACGRVAQTASCVEYESSFKVALVVWENIVSFYTLKQGNLEGPKLNCKFYKLYWQ